MSLNKIRFANFISKIALPLALLLNTAFFTLKSFPSFDFFPLANELQFAYYDAQLKSHQRSAIPPKDVVIVDIDEQSLSEIGRWPWDRHVLAQLTNTLFERYKIRALGFDVVFSEPQAVEALHALEEISRGIPESQARLEQLRSVLDNDLLFSQSLSRYPVVVGTASRSDGRDLPLPSIGFPSGTFCNVEQFPNLLEMKSFLGNTEQISKAARSSGMFNVRPDLDGKIRRINQLAKIKLNGRDVCIGSLSLALIQAATGATKPFPILNDGQVEALRMTLPASADGSPPRSIDIPVEAGYQTLIPFRGPQHSFPYISASSVLSLKAAPSDLAGKIIIVGSSAQGLLDLRSTPLDTHYPGVEAHANLVQSALDQTMLQHPDYLQGLNSLLTVVLALVSALSVLRMRALGSTLVCLLSAVFAIGLSDLLWTQNIAFSCSLPILAVLANWGLGMSFGYLGESRSRSLMADLFGQYVQPELVRMMSLNPEGYSMRGQKKELSVLFSDVRDFTQISESMPADQLSEMLGSYLEAMTECTRKTNGTLDKYIGDAVMAFWGAPVDNDFHAYFAVRTALQMLHRLKTLNVEFASKNWPQLRIGIGINTGSMSVGDMGTTVRRAYTVMGDAVNTASRLEGATKALRVPILVGEQTYLESCEWIEYKDLGTIRVKGKAEPLKIYTPLKIIGSPVKLQAQRDTPRAS